MSYNMTTLRFPSSDGKNSVYAEIYEPAYGEIRGILQLSHGMTDYVGRYEALAAYLTDAGFVFAGNCHLGHGRTASTPEDFGFFADKGGVDYLIDDLHLMNIQLKKKYPNVPIVIMGHSMGSFLSRLYVKKYPTDVVGHIIHGTGGPMPVILPMGKALARLVALLKGKRHRSKFIASMAFLGYNSKFDKSEGRHAWLTRDGELIAGRDEDSYSNFIFTVSAYLDLFTMVGKSNSREWFKSYPKDLKTLIMSGDMDPVGNYGKGPKYVYKHLLLSGSVATDIKLYEGARHELFNEICREEAFSDILKFLELAVK